MITVKEIEQAIREIFDNSRVRSVATTFEKDKDSDFQRLIISLHNLEFEDTIVIHTKLVFKCDMEKSELKDNSFNYLYDLNCIYRTIKFKDLVDFKEKLVKIINKNQFGADVRNLSEFLIGPAKKINEYFKKNQITDYSAFTVEYDPKFKIIPCQYINFDFSINLNNIYDIKLNVSKKDDETYKLQFKYLDTIKTVEQDNLKELSVIVGSTLIKIMKNIL